MLHLIRGLGINKKTLFSILILWVLLIEDIVAKRPTSRSIRRQRLLVVRRDGCIYNRHLRTPYSRNVPAQLWTKRTCIQRSWTQSPTHVHSQRNQTARARPYAQGRALGRWRRKARRARWPVSTPDSVAGPVQARRRRRNHRRCTAPRAPRTRRSVGASPSDAACAAVVPGCRKVPHSPWKRGRP
jgi:hypothetical protein